MKKTFLALVVITNCILCSFSALALDQATEDSSGLLSVRELSEQGKHLAAIKLLDDAAGLRSLSDLLYAAKSAWALGLISRARTIWDEALRHKDCNGIERGRMLLARSILEFQEAKYEDARAFAEDGASILSESELRGELWFVIGESLSQQGIWSLAEPYYQKAEKECNEDRKQEAIFRLAKVMMQLGKTAEARVALTKVELTSSITPQAIRELISIDDKQQNFGGVRTWVQEGRASHPSRFNDPEIYYHNVRALLGDGLEQEAIEEVSKEKVSAQDANPWRVLSQALIEESLAKKRISTGKNESQ